MASLLKWHVRPSVDTPALGRVSTSGSGALISAAHINLRSCKGSNCSCCCCSSSLSSPSRLLSSSLVSSRNSRTLRTNLPDFYHLKRKRTRGNSHIEALVKGVDYEFNEEGANLEVRVPLPEVKDGGVQFTARYVAVDAQPNSLCVGVQTPQGVQILLNASSLYGRIQPHETVWFVDETEVVLSLQKADKEQLWPDLVQAWEALAKGVASQLKGASVYIVGDSTEVNRSVAQELAAGLEYTPLHTQQLIEQLANVTVDQISADEGEDAVAGAEGVVLTSLSQHVRCVVATLGGSCGAASRQDGWKGLHSGFTIWLSQSRAQDEDSAKEEAVKAKQEGNSAYSKADAVVALSGWDDDAVRSKLSGDATLSESISELAFRVSVCAERRGLARLVHYFQLIGMKALNIPKVLPHVEPGIDKVMAKVEFLRSLGVKYLHLPVILVTWPQLLSYQCDTLALNVDYLVSLGLAHKDIGKMVIKFPQILGRDVQTELHKSVEILENLGVQLRDVKKLVVRYPVLLTEDAPKKLDPLVNYLTELGVRKEHIGTVLIRRPLLLDSDVEKDLLPVGNYLKSLNASPDDIDKILMSFPQLFCYDVDQDFRPTVLHLESLGVEPSLMGKLFRRHPQLLKNRRSLELKLDFLLSLGLEPKDLGKVIYNAPQLLCLSVGENMFPTVKFLESISIEGPSLLKVLKLKPMILAYNVETKLKPNVKFLRSIQIKQGEIGKLVARHPQLLTLSIDRNLKPTVNYLLKLGFTRGDVADMVRNLPSILGFSVVTVLAPKYGYLVDVMKRSRKEVVQFPQFFSYSLANRIIPRHQRLGKLFDLVSLSSVYGCSDDAFEKKAAKWDQCGPSLRSPRKRTN